MKNLGIKAKLVFMGLLVIFIVIVPFFYIYYKSTLKVAENSAIRIAKISYKGLEEVLNTQSEKLMSVAHQISSNHTAKVALLDNKTSELNNIISGAANEEADIIWVVDKEGKVVGNNNGLNSTGHKVVSLNKLVKTAIAENKVVKSYEVIESVDLNKFNPKLAEKIKMQRKETAGAKAGYVNKDIEQDAMVNIVIVPIVSDDSGSVIGAVISASVFNQNMDIVDRVKGNEDGIAVTIFKDDMRISTTVIANGSRAIGTLLSAKVVDTVLVCKQDFVGRAMVVGQPHWSYYSPVKNSEGRAIGCFFTAMSEEKLIEIVKKDFYTGGLTILGVIILIVIPILLFMSSNIYKSLTDSINKAVISLNNLLESLLNSSNELEGSSQQLAEGSAEQAASIEETSATLEETSSMVRQNTENTKQAAQLAKQVKEASNKGSREMSEMMASMEDIRKSSDQISKIIKVIDEIAFQTNILALNAAVEAARAGEAGQGFAVVAEEVRNLAQRSAQAAKDTAVIIDKNIDLSERGVEISSRVNEALGEINKGTQKVNDLLDEIAAASQEQAQGIEQINKAISQMEQVVQVNATSADQSASSSSELSALAENMKEIMNVLVAIVNGANASQQQISTAATSIKKQPTRKIHHETRPKIATSGKSDVTYNKTSKLTKLVNPEDVIPLEDDNSGF